jgi:hypothetical protein
MRDKSASEPTPYRMLLRLVSAVSLLVISTQVAVMMRLTLHNRIALIVLASLPAVGVPLLETGTAAARTITDGKSATRASTSLIAILSLSRPVLSGLFLSTVLYVFFTAHADYSIGPGF